MALLIIPRAYLIIYEGASRILAGLLKFKRSATITVWLSDFLLDSSIRDLRDTEGNSDILETFLPERIYITERATRPAGTHTSPNIACDIQWSEIQGRGDCSHKAHKCRAFRLRLPILGREKIKRVRINIFRGKALVLTVWQTMSSLMSTTGISA